MGAGAIGVLAWRRPLREPLVLVLLALALLGALSALWTLGPEERTLRWAGVTLGYAGVAVGAAAAARDRRSRLVLAAGLAAIAAAAGAAGLVAWATQDYPYALKLGGEWRPAGPFEYPPALALLMVSALPVFIEAARSRLRPLVVAGAAGVALSAVVIGLSGSRTGVAMGIAVAGVVLWRYHRLMPVAVAVAAVAVGSLAAGSADGPQSGFLHGRDDTWRAAVESFLDRPLHGAGADAFLAGSARHQDGAAISFAHNLPVELAAELGVAGLLLVLALYLAAARLAWGARATRAGWLFGPAVLAFLAASLLDWPWHLAGSGAVWALAAGALCGQANIEQNYEGDT